MKIPFAFLTGGLTGGNFRIPMPTFQPDGGNFSGGQFPLNVTISVQSPAVKFRYTINNTNIDVNNGTLVNAMSGVVTVNNHDVLRAIAVTAGNVGSNVNGATYDSDHGGDHGGGGPPLP